MTIAERPSTGTSPSALAQQRRARRTEHGRTLLAAQNRRQRALPAYAWYYRWYNRRSARIQLGHLAADAVPAPRLTDGAIVATGDLALYMTADEEALYRSGAYLEHAPPPAHRTKRQRRRLTPDEAEVIRARLTQAGYGPTAMPKNRQCGLQARLADEYGVTIGALTLLRRGVRHRAELLAQRRLDQQQEASA